MIFSFQFGALFSITVCMLKRSGELSSRMHIVPYSLPLEIEFAAKQKYIIIERLSFDRNDKQHTHTLAAQHNQHSCDLMVLW